MRNPKRLAAIRKLPCVNCGKPAPSEAAHANWSEYGKAFSRKSDDQYTISLCRVCHFDFDTYAKMNRSESVDWFAKMLEKTNRMLNVDNKEVF